MINTKKVAGCRELNFKTLDDILHDAQTLGRGEIVHMGNWSPAQIVDHVRMFMTGSREGFGFKAPLPLRMIFGPMKGMVVSKQPPRGIKLRGQMQRFKPDPAVTWDEAVAKLRREIELVNEGARFVHPSPLFGNLSHEQWIGLHCGHASMHFGFMKPADSDAQRTGSASGNGE